MKKGTPSSVGSFQKDMKGVGSSFNNSSDDSIVLRGGSSQRGSGRGKKGSKRKKMSEQPSRNNSAENILQNILKGGNLTQESEEEFKDPAIISMTLNDQIEKREELTLPTQNPIDIPKPPKQTTRRNRVKAPKEKKASVDSQDQTV